MRFHWLCTPLALILALGGAPADTWAAGTRSKRPKAQQSSGGAFELTADESVAEQVNDPTSFLREIGVDTSVEHGTGRNHTLVEWTPWLALPLGQRFRFQAGIPIIANGPEDRDDMELGDVYASLAYIFASSRDANFLADVRLDLPTGNELREAGLNVAQWHAALGSVIYTFQDRGFLIIPWLEYRRSMFGKAESRKVSSLLSSVRVVYFLSEDSYVRGEGTLSFNEHQDWRDAGLLGFEVGRVFWHRFSVAVGYECDLWGDAEIRNAANVSLSYLF